MTSALIGVIVAGVLAVLALGHHALEGRRVHIRQAERFHLKRYWKLLDALPEEALAEGLAGPKNLTDDLRCESLRYLRATEDACEMRERGDVSDRTWKIRGTAIRHQLERWPVHVLWQMVRDNGQFPHLARLYANDRLYDPCPYRRPRRYLRGLSPPLFKSHL